MNAPHRWKWLCCLLVVFTSCWEVASALAEDRPSPDYATAVAPLLRKYCSACHNDTDREGKLSVDNFDVLMKGGEHGAVVAPGSSDRSRMIRLLTGKAEPVMPPKDNERPKPHEIALLAAWIDSGAKGPTGAGPDPTMLVTPRVKLLAPVRDAVHAVSLSPRGDLMAVARHGEVELHSVADGRKLKELTGQRGSVNGVAFSSDGSLLATAAGEPSLFGESRLWRVADGALIKTFQGHRDSLQVVRLSPDGKTLATGGYDQKIKLWDVASGDELRTLEGHNGPVFDLAFHPQGNILASASGDRTVKLWSVANGARLDTLKEALFDLYTVAFAPDGQRVAAAGIDNRIRVWGVSETAKEGTNQLLYSQFAHELPVLRIAYSQDGKTLASTGEDRLVKIWNADTMTIRATLPSQPDWGVGLAFVLNANSVIVGRLDGTLQRFDFPPPPTDTKATAVPLDEVPPTVNYGPQPPMDQLPKIAEVEPNDAPPQATPLAIPAIATGRIFSAAGGSHDEDLYRIEAKAGDQWVLETNAARDKSPLDSKIEVLSADGRPVPRLLLRAVRDSEIEFRSMNSDQRGVRLKNWEEMLLNEFVYINGEVIKHYQQRRGPDADSQFYPEGGSRFAFFETSSRAHALAQPSYVVVPYAIGTELPNNGLPVFTLNFENDDDSQRKLGKDSRLTFVAPADGSYLIRVSDVRGFSGDGFHYQLIVRRPQPSFSVTLAGANPTVNAASGKQFTVKADRTDNFNGPIRVDITGLPPGFSVTTPIVIQAGLYEAKGVVHALPNAPAPTEANWSLTKVTATADIAGQAITKDVNNLGTIKRADKPKVIAFLEPDPANAESVAAVPGADELSFPQPPQVTIVPGRRTTCRLRVERNGFTDRISLEVENLPHGVIVDDIGLNGILIPEGQTERIIFLSCEPWVPATDRLFYATAKVEGDQVTQPMLLHVRPRE